MWHKQGLVVQASGGELTASHAMLPTPLLLSDRIRLYFASCDRELRGRIFSVDLTIEPPHKILSSSGVPVLDLGEGDAFDRDGINPSCIVSSGDELRLYTIGWRRGSDREPYTLFAGLAVSSDGGTTFRKRSEPILPPTDRERLFRTAPFVWQEGPDWNMIYIAGSEFEPEQDDKMLPRYSLHRLRSPDGVSWAGNGQALLNPDASKGEIGFGRPLLRTDDNGVVRLMLSIRTGTGYTLAETDWEDAQRGVFDFEPVLPRGPEAWDSQMTCFGAPLKLPDRELLFYNGNGFGRTGIGVAYRSISSS